MSNYDNTITDRGRSARMAATVVGAVFLLVGVPLNTADDWLHFVLGLGMIGLGVAGRAAMRKTVAGGRTA